MARRPTTLSPPRGAERSLRLDPALVPLMRVAAAAVGLSVNAWIASAVQAQLLREAHAAPSGPLAAALDGQASPPRS